MPVGDWNALGVTIEDSFHRSEAAARRRAAELAQSYGVTVQS
jgi:hypothetical protein